MAEPDRRSNLIPLTLTLLGVTSSAALFVAQTAYQTGATVERLGAQIALLSFRVEQLEKRLTQPVKMP